MAGFWAPAGPCSPLRCRCRSGAARIVDRHFADSHSVLVGLSCRHAPHTPPQASPDRTALAGPGRDLPTLPRHAGGLSPRHAAPRGDPRRQTQALPDLPGGRHGACTADRAECRLAGRPPRHRRRLTRSRSGRGCRADDPIAIAVGAGVHQHLQTIDEVVAARLFDSVGVDLQARERIRRFRRRPAISRRADLGLRDRPGILGGRRSRRAKPSRSPPAILRMKCTPPQHTLCQNL
jgi:hypothetical protein